MPRPLFNRPIAHRGLHDLNQGIVENSASAFAAAIAGGFAIECDLQLSADGVPVVFHDDTLERLTGQKGFIRDLSADQIKALPLLGSAAGDRPQLFSEFLGQVNGRAMLQVELKKQIGPATGMLAKKAAEALASYQGPVTVESFDPSLVALVRRFGFKGPVGIITYGYDQPEWDDQLNLSGAQRFFLRHLLHWPWTRFDFISCYSGSMTLPAVRFWRALGKPVTAWTVRTRHDAAAVQPYADQIVFEGFDPDRA